MVRLKSMDDIFNHKVKHRRGSNKHLRTMVSSLVTNLEHFQQELVVVVNDIKDLMSQIDDISNKLDIKFGDNWKEDTEKSPEVSPRLAAKSNVKDRNINHHYVNVELIPKIQEIENKIKMRITSKETTQHSISLDTEKRANRPKSLTDEPINKLDVETTCCISKKEKLDKVLDSLESPMLDLSYIGMAPPNNRPCWGRSISLPLTDGICNTSSLNPKEFHTIMFKPEHEKSIISPTAVCYAELKHHYVMLNSSNSSPDDVFYDIKTSTPTTIKSPDTSSLISNISIDGDIYERNLDHELENIIETSEDSLHNDSSDITMETGSNAHSETFSDHADGQYDASTWTSFNLSTSRGSSVSYVSDTTSEIINDNSMPPMGNIFSSSMLARKLSKHVENDLVDLNQNVKHDYS